MIRLGARRPPVQADLGVRIATSATLRVCIAGAVVALWAFQLVTSQALGSLSLGKPGLVGVMDLSDWYATRAIAT